MPGHADPREALIRRTLYANDNPGGCSMTQTTVEYSLLVEREDLEHLDEALSSIAHDDPDLLDMPGLMHLRNNIARALGLPAIAFEAYRQVSAITDIYW